MSSTEVLSGQGVAGQVNVSESAQVLLGKSGWTGDGAGRTVQISGEDQKKQEKVGAMNSVVMLRRHWMFKNPQQLLTKGLLNRIYWKVAVGCLWGKGTVRRGPIRWIEIWY